MAAVFWNSVAGFLMVILYQLKVVKLLFICKKKKKKILKGKYMSGLHIASCIGQGLSKMPSD